MDVEEGKLEEEPVDKPGTTIGTKFFVLHCFRIPFLMIRSFDRSSPRMSIRVHRKAFQVIKLLAYPRGLSLSKIYPILQRTLWPYSFVCTSPLAVITFVGLLDVVTASNLAEFKNLD